MNITEEQKELIIDIDQTVKHILANNGDDKTILLTFFPQIPEIFSLIKSEFREEVDSYIQKYEVFYYYMKLLENTAQGIADGTIKVPDNF